MFESLDRLDPLLPPIAAVVFLLVVAIVADRIAGGTLRLLTRYALNNTDSNWDDALVEQKAFRWCAQIFPGALVYFGIDFMPIMAGSLLLAVVKNITVGYIVLMVTLTLAAVLRATNQIYESYAVSRDRPIKGFIQLAQVIVYILGGILLVSAIIDRSPIILLSGFGAMTAVLLLVFKDTILSLVASIQLTGQDMLNVGDWLEMPAYDADGDVIDIALYTVTVQNWDKTITRIPTHALISNSFKNWRGMNEAGGRRIKRAINIDLSSIRFLSTDEIERLKQARLLHDYILEKQQQITIHNKDSGVTTGTMEKTNSRNLTNIGTFRAYIINYLRENPHIHDDMTMIVRQLSPSREGLPIEVYAFSNITNWSEYEDVQSDIFDHLLAVVPEFGLKLFQEPSGADFKSMR